MNTNTFPKASIGSALKVHNNVIECLKPDGVPYFQIYYTDGGHITSAFWYKDVIVADSDINNSQLIYINRYVHYVIDKGSNPDDYFKYHTTDKRELENERKERDENANSNASSCPEGTPGPDMTFFLTGTGKVAGAVISGTGSAVAAGVGALKDRHARKKQQEEESTKARKEQWEHMVEEMNSRRRQAIIESQEELPKYISKIEMIISKEMEYAQEKVEDIKKKPTNLSSDKWVSEYKKARDAAKEEYYTKKMKKLLEDADCDLLSEDIEILESKTAYSKGSKKVQKAWKARAEAIKEFAVNNYGDSKELKQLIKEENYEEIEAQLDDCTLVDEIKDLKLPNDAGHAVAFIEYLSQKIKDNSIDMDRRRAWINCYKDSVQAASMQFPNDADINALIALREKTLKESRREKIKYHLPAITFSALLFGTPIIDCLTMDEIGWGIFLAIGWIGIFSVAWWMFDFGEIILKEMPKSKVLMIFWWIWLVATLVPLHIPDLEWYVYVLIVIGSLITAFILYLKSL